MESKLNNYVKDFEESENIEETPVVGQFSMPIDRQFEALDKKYR